MRSLLTLAAARYASQAILFAAEFTKHRLGIAHR